VGSGGEGKGGGKQGDCKMKVACKSEDARCTVSMSNCVYV
jgi:hypothetical protein